MAEQAEVVHRGCTAARPGDGRVIDLHLVRRAAEAAGVERPHAASLVALPDGAIDGGGDGFAGSLPAMKWVFRGFGRVRCVNRRRRCSQRGLPRPLHQAATRGPASRGAGRAPPPAPARWWRRGSRARARRGRLRASSGTAAHGDVEAAEVGRQWLDVVARNGDSPRGRGRERFWRRN